ncbi:MAG TPA: DUF5698 domain-containing protein [Rhodothermales bacterium]|nr:DUF5698 domain-containing protein [Rhodothermales bacterium]
MTRTILAVRGYRGKAALIGFFEVLVWLFAVGNALKHLDSPLHLIGYASGFAAGNFVGITLEGRFAVGLSVVRAVFRADLQGKGGAAAAAVLREHGYAVTEMPGRGRESEVTILDVVVRRKCVPEVLRLLNTADSTAFVTVEEVRTVQGGHMNPLSLNAANRRLPVSMRFRSFRSTRYAVPRLDSMPPVAEPLEHIPASANAVA